MYLKQSKSHQTSNDNGVGGEHYAVSSITHTSSNQCGHESFDEDEDSCCCESASSTAVKAQILKTQQQSQQYSQHQQSSLQNHAGLVSKASIESGSDCNSYTKSKDLIMYADSQYDQVDCANQYQVCSDGQQTSSSSDEFIRIGTAVALFDYRSECWLSEYY